MKFNKYFLLLGLATSGMALTTACSDQDDEITSLEYDRLFSPIHLEARVVNQVNVRLSWYAVKGADSYTIQVYNSVDQDSEVDEDETTNDITVTGTPIKTIEGISGDEIPYIVTGLEGDTKYTFVVSAQGENITSSKGTSVEAKTGTEQILKTVADEDIEANSAVIRWTSSAVGATLQITPGDIEHTITAAEDADMAATISGLTGETEYTVKLVSASGKTRGNTTFKTAVDLGGAVAVKPGDDVQSIIDAAEAGAVLAFYPGTYSYVSKVGDDGNPVYGSYKITKDVKFTAVRPSDRPVINANLQLSGGASFTASQVVFDGTGTDGSQAFDYKEAASYDSFSLDDCEIKNYTKGFLYGAVACKITTITINNCLIHDIECSGGDMFDTRSGDYSVFNFTENTVWNSCSSRDLFRNNNSTSLFANSELNVLNNTLVDVHSNAEDATYRILYVRKGCTTINFKNNIVAGTAGVNGFSNQSSTVTPTFSNNIYYNTSNLVSAVDGSSAKFYDASGTVADPKFKDAANGDFTVGDEDIAYKKVGASRWLN
jgi:hypothetical protein